MKIRFQRVRETSCEVSAPAYATTGAAGIDLPAAISEALVIQPGQRVLVPTGLAVEIPSRDMVALVFPRSGLAYKHGLSLANAVGVIDSDYRGEIFCPVQNNSKQSYRIKPGERIAQLVFMPVFQVQIEIADELINTARGEGGFGSTGR